MRHIRPGESPLAPAPTTTTTTSTSAPKASRAHTRRQSTSSTTTTTHPAPHRLDPSTTYLTPRILPRRMLSLNDPGRPQGGRPLPTATSNPNFRSAAEKNTPQAPHGSGGAHLPSVPEFAYGGRGGNGNGNGNRNGAAHGHGHGHGPGAKTVSNSYSLPANLTAGYHARSSAATRPPHPSSSSSSSSSSNGSNGNPRRQRRSGYTPGARVSAPQNLDSDPACSGSPQDDRETQSSRIVRRSFSSTSYRSLTAERPADYDDPVGAPKVYNYMPSGYWAGRTSSILDRLAAECPGVALAERVKVAFGDLLAMACGPGAEQSLMEFKRAFERKMKEGGV